jgi:hypothetical protein
MNIYQMYAHLGNQVDFWIIRDSWGNTLAQVREIEGTETGQKLPGRAPYHGNPRVFADVYNTSGQLLQARAVVSGPGTYAYELAEPSPELLAAMGFVVEAPPAPAAEAAVLDGASTTFPYQDIRTRVEQGELTVAAAFELLKKLPKPWETAEWKARRKEVLQDSCECCGGQQSLKLFNRALPQKYMDVRRNFINEIMVESIRSVFDSITDAEAAAVMHSERREACPECGVITFRTRKNITPKHVCARGHEFEQPVERDYYAVSKTTDRAKAMDAAKSYLASVRLQAVIKEHNEEITRVALLESLAQSAEYVKLSHVVTMCSSCHFRARSGTIQNKDWKTPLAPLITRFALFATQPAVQATPPA